MEKAFEAREVEGKWEIGYYQDEARKEWRLLQTFLYLQMVPENT